MQLSDERCPFLVSPCCVRCGSGTRRLVRIYDVYVTHHRCVPASGVTQQQSGVRRRDETLPAERCAQPVQDPRGRARDGARRRKRAWSRPHCQYRAYEARPLRRSHPAASPTQRGRARSRRDSSTSPTTTPSAVVGDIFQFWASPDQWKHTQRSAWIALPSCARPALHPPLQPPLRATAARAQCRLP